MCEVCACIIVLINLSHHIRLEQANIFYWNLEREKKNLIDMFHTFRIDLAEQWSLKQMPKAVTVILSRPLSQQLKYSVSRINSIHIYSCIHNLTLLSSDVGWVAGCWVCSWKRKHNFRLYLLLLLFRKSHPSRPTPTPHPQHWIFHFIRRRCVDGTER